MGLLMLSVIPTLLGNPIADMAISIVDPRIRLS
jgi:ABC-type dipeptide/oligopeptide/nickel transport system permease component